MKKFFSPTDQEDRSLFTRRMVVLGGCKALLASVVMGRLGYLGLVRASHYRTLADGNRIKLQILLPKRGLIKDRAGIELANTKMCYRLVITPSDVPDLKATLARLHQDFPFILESPEELYQDIKKHSKFKPYVLKHVLSWDEVCKVQLDRLELTGIDLEIEHDRFYPFPQECAHLVGYVQAPSEQDNIAEELMNKPDYRLGRTGIEKHFDTLLQGRAGYQEIEVNAHRRVIRDIRRTESIQGGDLILSIDLRLQQKLTHLLAKVQSGAGVVLDIKTGEIQACVSGPSFDNNLFVNGIGHEDWKDLNENPYRPLHNKVLQGLYPPGSIFKMVVALAALSSGLISPNHRCQCQGYIEIHSHRFHCVHRQGHGSVDVVQALQMSCDVYFYEIAMKIGIDRIAQMAAMLGFAELTGIELPQEKKGRVPDRVWKRQQLNLPWTVGDTIITSIGQGSTLSSPLHMAVLLARLASGRRVIPTLLKTKETHSFFFEPLNIAEAHLKIVRKGLEKAVNEPGGTAYGSRILTPQGLMAGKTATSQVRRISKAERKSGVLKNEDIEWKRRDHGIFAGYAPMQDPRYAVCVLVEHGGGGSRVAAPIARDILLEIQKREAQHEA